MPLKTNRRDEGTGISEGEELVDSENEDSPNEANDPSTQSRRRHQRVVRVGNRGPDFGVWRLLQYHRDRRVKVGVVDVDALHIPWYFGYTEPRRERNINITIMIIGGVPVLQDTLLNVGVLPPVFRDGHG
jgi:hypothetical protein